MALTGRFVDVQIVGDDAARRRFSGFGGFFRDRVRDALLRIGVEFRDDARDLAPHRHGDLADSLKVKLTETADTINVAIGPPLFYGAFQEFGVNEKTVEVTNRRDRRGDVRGVVGLGIRYSKGKRNLEKYGKEGIVARGVIKNGIAHKGTQATFKKRVRTPPHPFMSPALARIQGRVQLILAAAVQNAAEQT